MEILDGKKVAASLVEELKTRVKHLKKRPLLTIVQVGNLPASNKYVANKIAKAHEIGIKTKLVKLNETIDEQKLKSKVIKKSKRSTGLIVQLPLPYNIDKQDILNAIPYEKDVDGLSGGNPIITPATPKGIITLLKAYNISLKDKHVAVVGQSHLVGMPVSLLCEHEGAKKVSRYTKETGIKGTEKADILIVAAGEANLIKKENIKPGVVIIDVGINTIADKVAMTKIVGDVDKRSVGTLPSAISPVPGGVGPMTVISLMQNVVEAAERKNSK